MLKININKRLWNDYKDVSKGKKSKKNERQKRNRMGKNQKTNS